MILLIYCLGVLGLEVHRSGHMEDPRAPFDRLIEASVLREISLPQCQVCFRLWQLQEVFDLLRVICHNHSIIKNYGIMKFAVIIP